jgi:hypothetical protein
MSTPTVPLGGDSAGATPASTSSRREDMMRYSLAFAVLLSFDAAVYLFSTTKSQLQGETIGLIIGILGTSGIGVTIGYYFGSSSGSKAKDQAKQ